MTKKIISYSIFLLVIVLFGCTSKTVNNPVYPEDGGVFTYTVEGFKDVSLERVDNVSLHILVKKLTGTSEKVTFSQFDLPDGMEFKMDKTIEEPSFNTFASITTQRTKIGTYPIRITSASPTTGITEYKINVTVTDYANAATGLKGDFIEKGNCSTTGHDVNVVIDGNKTNRIIIRGFWQGTMTNEIYADLDPANKTLNIPSQSLFGLTYVGSGSYTDDGMTIAYTVNGQTVSSNCSSTFTRK